MSKEVKRENGFYWVIYGAGRYQDWEVAQFKDGFWNVIDSVTIFEDIDFKHINETRLTPPES